MRDDANGQYEWHPQHHTRCSWKAADCDRAEPKIQACCNPIVRVSQDTECGRRDDGFPCRGMRGGDAGEMGHSSSVSTLPRRLNRGIEAVLCCLLNKFALKMRGTDRVSVIEGEEVGS